MFHKPSVAALLSVSLFLKSPKEIDIILERYISTFVVLVSKKRYVLCVHYRFEVGCHYSVQIKKSSFLF